MTSLTRRITGRGRLAALLLGWFAIGLSAQGLKLATPAQLRGVPLASTPFSGVEYPPRIDLSEHLPPPGDQGAQDSCLGWTLAYALKSYQERVEQGWELAAADGRADPRHVFSPAFVYNQINDGEDGGSHFADGLNLLSQVGVSLWEDMPYQERDFLSQPSAATLASAKRYRIDHWRQVNVRDLKEIKAHLYAGYPVMIGADVDEGFRRAGRDFVWQRQQGRMLGGHAMLVVGYDDRKAAVKVLNSWGDKWGDDGYGWIAYGHFTRVVNEGYVAKDARNAPPPRQHVVATSDPGPGPRGGPPEAEALAPQASVTVTNVHHNVRLPDQGDSLGMQLRGNLRIPPGRGQTAQVVIHFFWDTGNGRKGDSVVGTDARYRDVHGNAVIGTPPAALNEQGWDTAWHAFVPYSAMLLPRGQWLRDPTGQRQQQPLTSRLLAEPLLFIDNFGVTSGGIIPFLVNW